MDLTDELSRLERRMKELQAETDRLTTELERLNTEAQMQDPGDSPGSADSAGGKSVAED
jgi:hypothetical protein